MNILQRFALIMTVTFAVPLASQSADQKEAVKLVKAAIALGKASGKDQLFKEVSMANGKFHVTSETALYILVYDLNGTCLAHGFKVAQVGTNRLQVKDVDGKAYVQEFMRAGKEKGSGWVDYKYQNPTTLKLENKSTYVELWGDYIVGCGIYK